MVSRFSPETACLTPLKEGLKVKGARPVPFENGYFTGWLLDVADLPRAVEVSVPGEGR